MSRYERSINLVVNGAARSIVVAPSMTLLEAVRDQLVLTGSKACCMEGECGACTMLIDGDPVNACMVLAVEADGRDVTTIEGIGTDGAMTLLQKSFLATGAVQCGFCIPGIVVAATAMLERSPHPTETEVREALSGNLCRCGGYQRITAAVLSAADIGGSDG